MSSETLRIIEPRKGVQFLDVRELLRYRDLFLFLVWRDVRVRYRQTVLGFAWAVIPPVVSMGLFSVVFGRLAKVPSDGLPYPLFAYVALVPWAYFSGSLTASSGSLAGNALVSKVYFPRLILPLTPVLVNLIDFAIASSLIGVLMLFYGVAPSWNVLLLPLPIALMMLTASGLGLLLASAAVQFRDVKLATGFLAQLLMYAAPVVWPASLIPESYRPLYGLYPMAGVIEAFRAAILGNRPMPWDLLLPGTLAALAIFVAGTLYFRRKERIFADVF